ncbi:MAG TPA: hypothetical protein PLH57_02145 [Oligoflexia bacterium]|nr:hypothetical protein [Oligoflexia bacterium]
MIAKFERITASSEDILTTPAARRILKNLRRYSMLPDNFESPEIISADRLSQELAFRATSQPAPYNTAVALGKKVLHLTTQPGTSVKQCPGTNNMLCCHYHIINMVSNCPFDCSYCYLQTYLNQTLTTFFVNEDDIFEQVRNICKRPPVSLLRIGTGELSDSLALDHLTEFSGRLANIMGEYQNVRLELKTKSKNVEHLLSIPKKDHVIISWSMNPPIIVEREEHGTARFDERIRAAAMAAGAGFRVGFHFDPLIYFDGWKDHYSAALEKLLAEVPHRSIDWISLGALRFQPQMRAIALKRRPETQIFQEESVTGADGKVRYLKEIRSEMFGFINKKIKDLAPSIYTYLCMETKPVWEKALGRLPDRGF